MMSCTSQKHTTYSRSNKDSVGKSETTVITETKTTEDIDTSFVVSGSELWGAWDLEDTSEQIIESDELIVTTKVKKGKATVHAQSKDKVIPIKINKVTESKVSAVSKSETKLKEKIVTEQKDKEVKGFTVPWWAYVFFGICIILFLAFRYWKGKVDEITEDFI